MIIVPISVSTSDPPPSIPLAGHDTSLTVRAVEQSSHLTTAQQSPGTIAPGAKPTQRTKVEITVPLDENVTRESSSRQTTTVHGTRKLLRRDSLDRREALLKGKEGTRQRRRWENDRLLSNPHAEPPLPSDWEIRPTHPRRTIPYYLAPLWDAAEFQRAIESKLKGNRRNSIRHGRSGGKLTAYDAGMSPMEEAAASIPKEIRSRLKHARSAKGLLQDLEEDVRTFVRRWNEREMKLRQDGLGDAPLPGIGSVQGEEEDEEIVFVGRNGTMHDLPSSPLDSPMKGQDTDETLIATEKLVFQAPYSDKGAGFARWLVHCVGSYYGLRTWSVTTEVDGEQKRQAYVGVDARVRGFRGRCVEMESGSEIELPRPLWGMV